MKAISLLLSLFLVVSVASVGLGVVEINDLMEDPVKELSEIPTKIQLIISSTQQPETTDDTTTETGDSETPDTGTTDTPESSKPWQDIDCTMDPLPNPPGYVDITPGWNSMEYEVNPEYAYEGFQLVHDAGEIFALGSWGTLLRLDDGFWTKLDSNTTASLSGMMLGTWPSYVIGGYGVIRSYSPVTGSVKNFESPFDDMDYYDRPDLITAFGSNHEDFYILGDGVFYHYHHLPPSHPDYNASDPTPKWEYVSMPISPASIRGPYDPYISDVWVYDYDTVFMLVTNSGAGTQLMYEWDGNDWTEGDNLPTSSLIRGIWGLGPDDIFAVGVGGTILHFDGVEWNEYNNLGLDQWNSYTDIWGTSHSNLYVVGDSSTTSSPLMHYDGEYWTGMDVPTTDGLGSIIGWGEGHHTVYFAGYEGGIYHYLNAIAGQGENLGWLSVTSDYQPAFKDYANDDNTIYMGGLYWPSGDIGVKTIFATTKGGVVNAISINPDTGYSSVDAIGVTDEKLYASGWATSADYYVCTMSKNGGDPTYFYETLDDANVTVRRMAVDEEGNIIIAGLIEGTMGDQTSSGQQGEIPEGWTIEPHAFDAFIAKYTPTGERLWSQIFGAPDLPRPYGSQQGERIDRVIVDKNGDIVVVGYTLTANSFTVGGESGLAVSPEDIGNDGFNENFVFVIKFSPDGTPIIASAWDLESYNLDIEESSDGYYVSGYSDYAEYDDEVVYFGRSDLFVKRLSSDLDVIWSRYMDAFKNQWFRDSAVAPDDSIYLTGLTTGSFGGHSYVGGSDIFVTKLNAEGVIQGTKLLGGTDRDEGKFIYVDQFGNPTVYAATSSTDIFGYEASTYGFIWSDIEIPTDPYAECRLFFR